MTRAHPPRSAARLGLPAVALAVSVLAGACSDGDPSAVPGADGSRRLSEPKGAPTLVVEPVTRLGRVTGALDRHDRRRVEEQVSRVAVRWMTAAYVGGSYPRLRFRDALPGFTAGARDVARRDLGVLSNDPIGGRVDRVTPTRIEVEVDALAVDRRPVGATAHVLTTYETEGAVERNLRVAGRLMLTRRDGDWKIFAYSVRKGDR